MKKILIIGESCRDIFVYCHAERLAPDLPVPVLRVIEETSNPGMAGNVQRNIKAIYPRSTLVTNPKWKKVTKTRYVHRNTNHSFIRIDTEPIVERIKLKGVPLKNHDIVVISDYNKGFLTEEDIADICRRHPCVLIDTKKKLGPWAEKAKFIKINNYEYERSKGALTPRIREKLIVTHGESGAEHKKKHYPVGRKVEVKDLTGAGDSFFAGLVVRYAETGNIEEAIRFANECASQVVAQKGVTTITRPKQKATA